jgi:hypothetical protein
VRGAWVQEGAECLHAIHTHVGYRPRQVHEYYAGKLKKCRVPQMRSNLDCWAIQCSGTQVVSGDLAVGMFPVIATDPHFAPR